jgi:hypothetical protein
VNGREFTPVFIVGSSRSGTTMMNRILGQHPEVAAFNELHYIGAIWEVESPLLNVSSERAAEFAALLLMHIRYGIWCGPAGEQDIADAKSIVSAKDTWTHPEIYQQVLHHEAGPGIGLVTDQTPRNVLFASDILEIFPTARIIHMIRDPRAVLASQRNRWKKRWLGADTMPIRNVLRVLVNYHPYTLTKLWIKSARVAAQLRSNERYKVVEFEQVTRDPEREIRAISRFLGIEFRPSMLDVPQVGSSNKVHDDTKVGVSSDVVDTWKQTLPKGDVVICERMAAELMRDYSYEPVSKSEWSWRVLGPLIRFPFHILGAVILNLGVVRIHIRAMVKKKW